MSIKANFPSIRPSLLLDFANVKALDPRITFTRASTGTYFDAKGVLQTAVSGQARFDHNPTTLAPLGLLIEEQGTNSIRNNTMQGAVAGTPGTAPTNWAISTTGNGVTREIVGVGTENGITYIDIKYSGTPTAGTNVQIAFEAANSIAASNGQTWTNSTYVSLVGGATTNTTITLSSLETNGTSGVLDNSKTITPTAGSLTSKREALTATLSGGGTVTNIQSRIRIGYTVGSAIDITLRIGLPQLELGAFATSVIPTTTAAATRNADAASMTGTNFSSWYRADEGTLYADINFYALQSFKQGVNFNDGSTNNFMSIQTATSPASRVNVATGGVSQVAIATGNLTAGVDARLCFAYKTNDVAATLNGGSVGTDTSVTLPTVNQLGIGTTGSITSNGNQTIRKIAFYPTRLSNAQLQALTR
jgi:hypothetical protein